MKHLSFFIALSILFSCTLTAQWTHIGLSGRSIRDIATINNALFAVNADSGSVYRTMDQGISWSLMFESNGGKIVGLQNKKIIVQIGDSIFHSTDYGVSWTADPCPGSFCGSSPLGTLFARTVDGDIGGSWYCLNRSTDDGMSWMILSPPHTFPGDYLACFENGNVIAAGVTAWRGGSGYPYYGLTISSDDGVNWIPYDSPARDHTALAVTVNGFVFLGATSGIFLSTDTCTSWSKISTITSTYLLASSSGGILAGTNSAGIFLFSDDGDSLGTLNEGLSNLNVHTLAMDSLGYVYAGTDSGIFKIPVPQIAGVKEQTNNIPIGCKLEQNYPNPFNPMTVIKYQLPLDSRITLKIYNVLGQEVKTLVDEIQDLGYKSVTWDANNLTSGVYFYRITAGSYIETKKLLLLK